MIRYEEEEYTVLHLVGYFGFWCVVEECLKVGCDPNTQSKVRRETPLHLAAQNGHWVAAEWLLKGGADPNISNVEGLRVVDMDLT